MPKSVELCVKHRMGAGLKESIAWGTCQRDYKAGKLDETGHTKKSEVKQSLNIMQDAIDKALKERNKTMSDFKQAELTTERRKGLETGEFAFPRLKKLPIHDASHVRNAMARFNQTQGMTAEEKATAKRKIIRAAHKFGIDIKGFDESIKQSDMKGGEWMERLFLQAKADFTGFDFEKGTVPVELVRSGMATIGIDGKPAKIYISPNRLEEMKASLESSTTNRKSYWGHVSSDRLKAEGKLHRDNEDWIGTLGDSFNVVSKVDKKGNNYIALEGQLRVHGEGEKSKMLQGLIKKEPEQIKFSLDYAGRTKVGKRNGELVHELSEVSFIRSLDFVPESGFDNGISMSAITQCAEYLNSKIKEVSDMKFDEWKEAHPEEYKDVISKITQTATEEIEKKYKEDIDELKSVIAKMDADLKQAKMEKTDKKGVELKDTAEYQSLLQANQILIESNKKAEERAKATDKRLAIIEEKERMDRANQIIQSKLEGSRIPKNLHPKVKSQIDYNAFLTEEGQFSADSDDVVKFTQAVADEVKDWEDKLKGMTSTVTIGMRDTKTDDITQANPYIAQIKDTVEEFKGVKGGNK